MINRWWWVRYTTQGVKLGIDLTMSIKREVVVVETRDTHKYEASAALCTYIRSNTMQHLMTVFTWSLTQFSYSDVELNQSYTQQMPYHQEVFNRMHLYKSSVVSCLNLTITFHWLQSYKTMYAYLQQCTSGFQRLKYLLVGVEVLGFWDWGEPSPSNSSQREVRALYSLCKW